MSAPTCRTHEEVRARHAVRLQGETGLTQVCCACAEAAGRNCEH